VARAARFPEPEMMPVARLPLPPRLRSSTPTPRRRRRGFPPATGCAFRKKNLKILGTHLEIYFRPKNG
jgi:hypothetical protein